MKEVKPRATKFEVAKRKARIRELIMEGLSHKEIIAHCLHTLEWDMNDPQLRKYIREVERSMTDNFQQEKGMSLTTAISRLERMYADAVKRGDTPSVARAIELSAKLSGLMIDRRSEVKDVDQLQDISTADVLQLLKKTEKD